MSFAQDWSAADIAQKLSGTGKAKAKKTGRGWMVCCPAHDDRTPSLSLADGKDGVLYYCFGGCQQKDVRAALEDRLGVSSSTYVRPERSQTPRKPVEEEWEVCRHVPDHAEISRDDFWHFEHGLPVRTWTYHDATGRVAGWVARYEGKDADGNLSKEVVPYAWCRRTATGTEEIRQKAMMVPRPLYNLKQILSESERPVLWNEGEKAADAAGLLFDEWVSTATQGGGRAVHMSDLRPLHRRKVILMPDNDRGGFTAVAEMAQKLQDHSDLYYLSWPTQWPNGDPYEIQEKDDIYDHVERGWTKDKLRACAARGHKLIERIRFLGEGLQIIHYDYESEKRFAR